MFNFPSYKQIINIPEGKSATDDGYSVAKAKALKPFIPPNFAPTTKLPALDAVIAKLSIPVVYDVPCIAEEELQEYPFTNQDTGIIHMPHPSAFVSPETWTHVVLHEVSHWVGKLLARQGGQGRPAWNFDIYALEELTAELTAMGFEQATINRELTPEDSLNYLRSFVDAPVVTPGMEFMAEFATHFMGAKIPPTDNAARFNKAMEQARTAVEFLVNKATA